MNKAVIIGIMVAVAVVGGALASPLFYETEIDEALPQAGSMTLEKFQEMDDVERVAWMDSMPEEMMEEMKQEIMDEAAETITAASDEMEMDGPEILRMGQFVGLAGHRAQGDAKVIQVDGSQYLRFESFEVTNGPDLRVYLTQDGDINQGIHLEKLKGSRGAQNYLLDGIDADMYDTVVIYCQPFGVYFGQAALG